MFIHNIITAIHEKQGESPTDSVPRVPAGSHVFNSGEIFR